MVSFSSTLFITFIFNTRSVLQTHSIISVFLLLIMILSLGIFVYIKFPLWVNESENELNDCYDESYSQKVNWIKCLYYSIFSIEQSKVASFSSGITLTLSKKGNIINYSLKNNKIKTIHRIFDFLLLIILSIIAYFAVIWATDYDWKFGFVLCIICLIVALKNHIIRYSMSIPVGERYGYNLRIVYPYSTLYHQKFKTLGIIFPFRKAIIISHEVYSDNTDVHDYVIAHERGHIEDNKANFAMCFILAIFLIYLTLGPYILPLLGNNYFAIIPIVTLYIYNITIGYKIRERSELCADEYAINALGKEKVLKALNLLQEKSMSSNKQESMLTLIFKPIPIERRIQFANEYAKNQKQNQNKLL